MISFHVCHDFTKYQPRKWIGDYVRKFGPRNEGFTIEARDIDDAKRIIREEHRLNPGLLTITAQ